MATAGAKTQPGPKHHKLAAELADAGLARPLDRAGRSGAGLWITPGKRKNF